jgi:hypothetical protein
MALKNLFGYISLDSTLQEIKDMLQTLMKPLTMITGSGSNRLSVDINAIAGNVAQVTLIPNVTAVGTVGNQTNMGGVSAFELQKAMSHTAYATSIIPNML